MQFKACSLNAMMGCSGVSRSYGHTVALWRIMCSDHESAKPAGGFALIPQGFLDSPATILQQGHPSFGVGYFIREPRSKKKSKGRHYWATLAFLQ